MKALLISVATLGIIAFGWQANAISIDVGKSKTIEVNKGKSHLVEIKNSFVCKSKNSKIASVGWAKAKKRLHEDVTISAKSKGSVKIMCKATYWSDITSFEELEVADFDVTVQ